uniref:Uncharacterized protein n=1 Tax=Strigamia maritima TaxID=126957 RepID=T1J5S3_STRMM
MSKVKNGYNLVKILALETKLNFYLSFHIPIMFPFDFSAASYLYTFYGITFLFFLAKKTEILWKIRLYIRAKVHGQGFWLGARLGKRRYETGRDEARLGTKANVMKYHCARSTKIRVKVWSVWRIEDPEEEI